MQKGHAQALAHAFAFDTPTLQIAVVGTSTDFKCNILNVMLLKSSASGRSEPDVRAAVAAKRQIAQTEWADEGWSRHVVNPHCN